MAPTNSTHFRMPAEWEPHASTWLAWPHRTSDWPRKFTPIPWVYADIVRILARFELVNILVKDAEHSASVAARLQKVGVHTPNVTLHTVPTNRSWLRDSGPIWVHDAQKQTVALDWQFTAWAKYPDWQVDDRVPAILAKRLQQMRHQPLSHGQRVVLEGGSIEVNGRGLLLTTEECLLSEDQQHRNPHMTRQDYEAVFAESLGIRKVLWLNRGIVGDDTHGHIDDVARFVNPTTIVTVVEPNTQDENHAILAENRERLQGMTDARGRKLTIVELPMPSPLAFRGQRVPASYANFYIANGVVLVPTFNDPLDRVALGTLADLFPDRAVVGIHCGDLIWGLGTLHCMTQQEPAAMT